MTEAQDDVADGLQYSHELVQRVNADQGCTYPWWFWPCAAIALVGSVVCSIFWPWGFA